MRSLGHTLLRVVVMIALLKGTNDAAYWTLYTMSRLEPRLVDVERAPAAALPVYASAD